MLRGLYIENVAVIEQAELEFTEGLTVMTGETGAGKSIIIDAIGMVLGQRTSKDLIRTGSERACVTALFSGLSKGVHSVLDRLGVAAPEDELQLFRDIRSGGKSLCKANGVPVTAAMLKELGVELIGIHGQHDSYELLSPEIHGEYLDNYGGLQELLHQYQQEYRRLKEIKAELDKLSMDEALKERRMDLLKYQIEELRDAKLLPGEREELQKRRTLIQGGEKLALALSSARGFLLGDEEENGAIAALISAADSLEKAADTLPQLGPLAESLRDMEYSLQDMGEELRGFEEEADYSPQELESIEERLDLLYRLSLKYGNTEEEMAKSLEGFEEELKGMELSDEKIELLGQEFEAVKAKAIALARELSAKRRECAAKFSQGVQSELKFLNMPSVEFTIALERTALFGKGCDKIQFLVSANPGEEPKPMSKIASGGELSRIMLAIKTVLAGGDTIATMIFDEIDTGISGEAANKVGKKLLQVSASRQVICITHLAQIAAMAQNHMLIEKSSNGQRTYTRVRALDREGRATELARMMGGDEITPLKKKMALEMLDKK